MSTEPLRLRVSRALAWASLLGMVALFSAVNVVDPEGAALRWLIQCAPLLIFLPGLLHRSHRAYSYLCFVVLLYFIAAVTGVMGPAGDWSDAVLLVLSVVLFVAATLTSRWLQRTPPPGTAPTTTIERTQ